MKRSPKQDQKTCVLYGGSCLAPLCVLDTYHSYDHVGRFLGRVDLDVTVRCVSQEGQTRPKQDGKYDQTSRYSLSCRQYNNDPKILDVIMQTPHPIQQPAIDINPTPELQIYPPV